MAIIYLVRHGQNEMVGKKLAGRLPGVHLNEQGHAQARQLAAELSALPIKAVFSSPLERTQQTAEPIARIHNLPVITEPGLIEIDFGAWQAKSLKQLRRNRLWRDVQEFPDGFSFPSGESFVAAQTRTSTACSPSAKPVRIQIRSSVSAIAIPSAWLSPISWGCP